MNLNEVIPLGRSFNEYVEMFGLSAADLKKKIIDCGSGPSSFNYELKIRNQYVTSIDPIYQFSSDQIKRRIDETFSNIIKQAEVNKDRFIWNNIKNVKELANIRMAAMNAFLEDYETGKKENRYLNEELPVLSFADNQFEIALCSHFLFLYTKLLSFDFHLKSIKEMLRVANEVRIFPLLDLNGDKSPYVEEIKKILEKDDVYVSIETVNYEFQRGGNQMLKIIKPDRY